MGSINGIRRGNAYHKVDQAFSTSQKAAKYAETVPDALVVPAREFTTEDTVQAFDMFGGNMYTGGRKAGGLKVDGGSRVSTEKEDIGKGDSSSRRAVVTDC